MQIINFCHHNLQISRLETGPQETWCFYGENLSGTDTLVDLLSGNLQNWSADSIQLPEHPGILSFRVQQEIFEFELKNDNTDILGMLDPGTLTWEFLPDFHNHLPLIKAFGLDHCLDVGYKYLSSGQCRKLILLRELIKGATTLVLQNPYDGLDETSCCELNHILPRLADQGIEVIITISIPSDIPDWCTHLAVITDKHIVHAGPRERVFPLILKESRLIPSRHQVNSTILFRYNAKVNQKSEELIFLQNGTAGYGDSLLFTGLDLVVRTGDHTLITGPNGSGKSTLLDIITGDNTRCYTNNLRLFGQKRGSGESIWDIKKNIGMVSPSLHRDYRVSCNLLQVVLSGLFDSIGLYKKVHDSACKIALDWLSWIGLQSKARSPFKSLSFAEQRLVLIARALIKRPKLLILDEATQGLDDHNRNNILMLLEEISNHGISTILYASHRKNEHKPFFIQKIPLDAYACSKGSSYISSHLGPHSELSDWPKF
jgi:molybdate transport system ATP-binding protein